MAYKRHRKPVRGLTKRKRHAVHRNLRRAQVSRIGIRGERKRHLGW